MGRVTAVRNRIALGTILLLSAGAVAGSAAAMGSAGGASGAAALRTVPETLHVHYAVVNGVVATNGAYTVITRPSGALVVVDETSGRRTRLHLPDYCRKPKGDSILGESWLLEPCKTSRLALYALARGRWHSIAVAPSCAHFHAGRDSSCNPTAIGKDWIQFDESSARHGDVSVFQNVDTGALRHDPTSARTFPDLDSARLAHELCAPLTIPSHTFVFFAFQGPFVLRTDEAGARLERCGTNRYWALPGALEATMGPGAVMWLQLGGRGQLDGIFIPSLQRFQVTLPTDATRVVYVQLSDRHIYLSGSTKHNLSATWSAQLPVANPS
jgi:hypothetical protein